MTETKNTGAPMRQMKFCRSNAFLAVLHMLVFVLSLAFHPPVEIGTVGALP